MTSTVHDALGAVTRDERLLNLRSLVDTNTEDIITSPLTDEVNNHVHTSYSFSPYTPTQAAWMARSAGLQAVGSVDHDSIAAAEETIQACKILRIGSTVGFELRVSFAGTPFGDRRLNNPDSIGIGYIAVHGVPRPRIPQVAEFLVPLQRERNERNRRQVTAMNRLLSELSAPEISYADVEANSRCAEGGSITERHILFTAAIGLMKWLQPGVRLREWIESHLATAVAPRLRTLLDDGENPHYVYDLIGILKSSFLPRFFIQPSERECIPVEGVVAFANEIGSVPAYAYLGDVAESPTGDKRAENYEDAFLDEFVPELTRIGFRAVTYMPPRNTRAQLRRVRQLCEANHLMEISGVDINSSRQSFTCPEIVEPEFRHLIDATWALIAHEKLTSVDPSLSLFAPGTDGATLQERITRYAVIGRAIDPAHPEDARNAAGL
jgi:hypothetical protein